MSVVSTRTPRFAMWPAEQLTEPAPDERLVEARQLMTQCRMKLAERDLDNAWGACGASLHQWLLYRWSDVRGTRAKPKEDNVALLARLRSAGIIDAWLFEALKLGGKRPEYLTIRHVVIFAALVDAVCFNKATV